MAAFAIGATAARRLAIKAKALAPAMTLFFILPPENSSTSVDQPSLALSPSPHSAPLFMHHPKVTFEIVWSYSQRD
jgi:hypothetical protein